MVGYIRSKGSHSVATLFRRIRSRDSHVSYYEVARDVAKKLKTEHINTDVWTLERQIIARAFEITLESMSSEERSKLEAIIEAEKERHEKSFTGVAVAGGAIALAQASGFGVYLMASTLVGGITDALGTTLPFAFYTGMSSTISVLIGPVGIALVAAWGIHNLGAPRHRVTVPSVIAVATIRARLVAAFEENEMRIESRLLEIYGILAEKP